MADLLMPGGGLTKSKLALATAQPNEVYRGKTFYGGSDKKLKTGTMAIDTATAITSDVSSGKTFYAGDKNVKTGTLVERGTYQNAGGVALVTSASPPYVAFNRIPEGIYRANGTDWGPEIRANASYVMDNIFGATSLGNYSDNGNTDGSTSLTRSFSLTAGNFYLFVCDVGTRDGSAISASLNTPNCTNLLNLSYSDTQDKAYYDSRLIVRIVRCNSNTTATASVSANNTRSAGRIFCYKLNNW